MTTTNYPYTYVTLVVRDKGFRMFEIEENSMDVLKEMERVGFWEDTAYNGTPSYTANTPDMYVFVNRLNQDSGWFAYLNGKETTDTRLSVLKAKLSVLKPNGVAARNLVRSYFANVTEAEQLEAIGTVVHPSMFRSVAVYAKTSKVQDALNALASKSA
jgi:hypothetical protein